MSRPRRLLALDAAGTACSAAIVVDGRLVAARFESMRRGHSERLVPMIGEVMAEAGLAYADLDAVGVTRGPGAFTGVRIGLATARAIGLAAGKPVVAATCFETALAAIPEELLTPADAARRVLVALDAKRADIYVQVFDGCGVVQGEPAALRPELLAEYVSDSAEEGLEQAVLVAGDAEPAALAALEAAGVAVTGVARQTGTPAQPNAASLAQLLASRDMPRTSAAPPRPLYLRPPDVTLPQ